MTQALVDLADQHNYQGLFIKQLRWSAPDIKPQIITLIDGTSLTLQNASTYKGIRVWVCDQLPGARAEVEVDKKLAATSTDRLVIFHDNQEQIWRWPVRSDKGYTTTTRLARHRHRAGAADPGFAHRLAAIQLPTDTVLDATAVLTRVREAFDVERQNETRHASKLMVAMYTAMEKAYPADYDLRRRNHEISVTLARTLFLMFGDDTDMWRPDAFRDHLLQDTTADGINLQSKLQLLFDQLNDPDAQGDAPLPYVNGGIFRERIILPAVGVEFRKAILEACKVDWSTISPAIFGSMFQSVRDEEARRTFGEHYTSEHNILKMLNPLFLDELRDALEKATTAKALNSLWHRLGEIRFMDPACGCGNFIIVAYRELRDLELQIMERLKDLHHKGSAESQLEFEPTLALKVTLDHFYGIEIDEWPARIAETAMFLIDRQCDLKLKERFGDAPQRLPIKKQATIRVGNALRIDWTTVCEASKNVIVAGNPPFRGPKERTAEQTSDLRVVWGGRYDGFLDYVTGWHAKTIGYFGDLDAVWAFVSTNSISQGQAVPTLWGYIRCRGWRTKFAFRTFPWTSEAANGAAVHCVIVGFARGTQAGALLFEHGIADLRERTTRVAGINAYLVDGPDILVTKRMRPVSPALPEVLAGSKAVDWGFLTVELEDLSQVQADPIAQKYLRPYRGGDELINGLDRWCLWFVGADLDEINTSSLISQRLAQVRALRLKSTKPTTRTSAATPHLFGERRQPNSAYLGIPQTFAENRHFATVSRLSADVIASIKLFTSSDPDGYLFSIISSSMFMTWQKTVGGRMKSDPSFTNTIVWNTLPLPGVKDVVRSEIVEAGRAIIKARSQSPGKNLAEQYEPRKMSKMLTAAHQDLDSLVDVAFGMDYRKEQSERKRQRVLFERYEELATGK